MPSRCVIIGASGGIGAALADAHERDGHDVVRMARSADDPACVLDVTDEASIARAAAACAGGPVDAVWVATGMLDAGPGTPEKNWRQLSGENLARYFAVNATGPALIAKHFLPLLPRRGRAVFAALSARVGSIGDNRLGGWYGYRASKAALNMLIKSLAIELGRSRPDAICVALHPGTVDTGLSRPFQTGVPADKLFTPAFTAGKLIEVVDGLTPADSGNCYAWDGRRIDP